MGRDSTGRDGTGWEGTEGDGIGEDGTGCCGRVRQGGSARGGVAPFPRRHRLRPPFPSPQGWAGGTRRAGPGKPPRGLHGDPLVPPLPSPCRTEPLRSLSHLPLSLAPVKAPLVTLHHSPDEIREMCYSRPSQLLLGPPRLPAASPVPRAMPRVPPAHPCRQCPVSFPVARFPRSPLFPPGPRSPLLSPSVPLCPPLSPQSPLRAVPWGGPDGAGR